MPPKHQSTKNHKRLNIIKIALVEFSVLGLWWQFFLLLGVVSSLLFIRVTEADIEVKL
jgi:hypothetical protein